VNGSLVYEQRPTPRAMAEGFAEFLLGVAFLQTLLDPTVLGGRWIQLALELITIEALLIHGSSFLNLQMSKDGPPKGYKRTIFLFAGIYLLFGFGLSVAFKSVGPLAAMVAFTAARTWAAVREPPPVEVRRRWFFMQASINLFFYVGAGAIGFVVAGFEFNRGAMVVVMAAAFYLARGIATMWAWPRRVDLTPFAT
jgi:hypothetical protein